MKKLEKFINSLDGKTIHIVGISGAEGSTIASFLLQHGCMNIVGHDFIERDKFKEQFFNYHDWMDEQQKEEAYTNIMQSGITFRFIDEYLLGINEQDVLFVPQSWFRYTFNDKLYNFFDSDHRPKKQYRENIYSLTQLYLMLFPGVTVGVTGSNGKSTTTALIAHILRHACEKEGQGRRVYWGGNDRKNDQPLLHLHAAKRSDMLVLEISNRQLSFDMRVSPNIAVITNIVPNHIDDHGTFENYIETKKEIVRYQKKGDIAILNYDNESTRNTYSIAKSQTFFFSTQEQELRGTFFKDGNIYFKDERGIFEIMSIRDMKLKGSHNVENVLASSAACFAIGIDSMTIAESVNEFPGLPYRIEYVDTVNGVEYYDDSSGCNPKNTPAAIHSFDAPLIVIVGGYRKNALPGEFSELAEVAHLPKVKKIILIGSIKETIAKDLENGGVRPDKIYQAEHLKEAVEYAHSLAVPGNIVILAPGCESFGEFKDYRDRGIKFKEYVKTLNQPE